MRGRPADLWSSAAAVVHLSTLGRAGSRRAIREGRPIEVAKRDCKPIEETLLEAGYAADSARQITNVLACIRPHVEPIVARLEAHRAKVMDRMEGAVEKAQYGELVRSLDVTTRHIRLLTGKSTHDFVFQAEHRHKLNELNRRMNYELAKELKDAGFPQEGNGARIAPPDKIVVRRDDFAYAPTLEELIEACGENFMRLENVAVNGWWEAYGRFWNSDGSMYRPDPSLGDNPAEAVAHLWLALKSQRYAGHEAHEGKN